MKNRILILFATLALLLAISACKNESNTNDTSSSTTSTSSTDTSATTSSTATTPTATSTSPTSTTGTATSSMSDDDKNFMMKAAQGGIGEVSLGSLAAQQGVSADVKTFGNRMVNDHGKANDELKQLAMTKGVTLPTDMDKESKDASDKLSKETGKTFDKDYTDAMVKGHEKVAADFEKESKNAKDPDLKAWVSKTLPTIQDHLKMAKEMQKKMK